MMVNIRRLEKKGAKSSKNDEIKVVIEVVVENNDRECFLFFFFS